MHASVLQCETCIIMRNYTTLHSPSEGLLRGAIQNYCTLQSVQVVNLENLLQTINAIFISNLNWAADINLFWNLTFENFF